MLEHVRDDVAADGVTNENEFTVSRNVFFDEAELVFHLTSESEKAFKDIRN